MATIVVPYVDGMLNPGTVEAVRGFGMEYRFVQLDRADEAGYGKLFRRLWSERRSVIICEHDVIPTWEQLWQLTVCDHDWCSYSYDGDLYPAGPMFGLARFSGRLMTEQPWAADVALVIGKRRDIEAEWWRVDALVARDLKIRGVEWVEHHPAVHHAHIGAPSGPA